MFVLLLVIHILVSVLLVFVIMMQSGQAGGVSSAFGGGGGGGQTLFGGRGAASFLGKATTYLGAAFLVVSLLLAFVQASRSTPAEGRNIFDAERAPMAAPAPGQTAPAGGQTGSMPAEGEGLIPPAESPTPQGEGAGQ